VENPRLHRHILFTFDHSNRDEILSYSHAFKFQNVLFDRIKYEQNSNHQINQMLYDQAENIKNIQYFNCGINFLTDKIKLFENLTSLKVSQLIWDDYQRLQEITLSLPNLKNLHIKYCEQFNLKDFEVVAPNLETLKIHHGLINNKILNKYKNLKVLEVTQWKLQSYHQNFNQIPQKLNSLKLKNEPNVKNLLESQHENLKELTLMNKNKSQEIEFIISSMVVEKLKIKVPKELLIDDFFANESIVDLTLVIVDEKDPKTFEVVKQILSLCPKVKNLRIKREKITLGQLWKKEKRSKVEVESLEFEIMKILTFFENVKNLILDFAFVDFKQEIFLPSIESILIKFENYLNIEGFKKFLLSLKNLKRLELIEEKSNYNPNFYEKKTFKFPTELIFENSPNLEEFESDILFLLNENDVKYLKDFNLKKLTINVDEEYYEDFCELQEEARRNLEEDQKILYWIFCN
jgi:hypothetical protein